MRKFEVCLRAEGDITLLPDSQKIFGYLMDKLSQKFERSLVAEFVKDVKGKCMVSNLIPSGYLPTPKSYLMRVIFENQRGCTEEHGNSTDMQELINSLALKLNNLNELKKDSKKNGKKEKKEIEQIKQKLTEEAKEIQSSSDKAIYETLKKMEYIKRQELPNLIQKLGKEKIRTKLIEKYDYITKVQKYVQKFKLESQTKGIPGLPNIAYSLPIVEYLNKSQKLQKDFSFFVVVEDHSILADVLCKEKDNIGALWMFGPKASSGYNCYKLIDIVEEKYTENLQPKSYYINLGMLLPQENSICWEKSAIDIYSSDRRAFELVENIKKVISFINVGSVLSSDQKEAYNIGNSIKNEYNKLYPDAIVFGNSYLEPLEV